MLRYITYKTIYITHIFLYFINPYVKSNNLINLQKNQYSIILRMAQQKKL